MLDSAFQAEPLTHCSDDFGHNPATFGLLFNVCVELDSNFSLDEYKLISFFNGLIYLRERERESKHDGAVGGGEREEQREREKQTPCRAGSL